MVNLVLNFSLAMVIGYSEISRQGKLMIATTFQIFLRMGISDDFLLCSNLDSSPTTSKIRRENKSPGLGISGGA